MSLRKQLHAKMATPVWVEGVTPQGRRFRYKTNGSPEDYRTRAGVSPRGKRKWRWGQTDDGRVVRMPSARERKNQRRAALQS